MTAILIVGAGLVGITMRQLRRLDLVERVGKAPAQPEIGGSELDRALKVIEGCLAVRGIAVHLAS